MPGVVDLQDLGSQQFVVLTSFRRSGEPVPTTVWVAADGEALVVTTPTGSGKVKRLRRDPRVTLQASSRFGRAAPDAPVVAARAVPEDDPTRRRSAETALARKYGLPYRFVLWLERRRGGDRPRTILRITAG